MMQTLNRDLPVQKTISFAGRKAACPTGGVILVLEKDSNTTKILKRAGAMDGRALEITHLNWEIDLFGTPQK